jgi:hypothetical protein
VNGHSDVVGLEEEGLIVFNEETGCYEEVEAEDDKESDHS